MAEFLPLCDVLFNVISLAGYFCDVVFDLVMSYALLERGYKASFTAAISIVITSLVITQVLSLRWYLSAWSASERKARAPYLVMALHCLQLGVLWRYARLLAPLELRRGHVKHQVRDLCMLRLVHAFCEAAPMLLLQLHILFKVPPEPGGEVAIEEPTANKAFEELNVISASLSLFSVCWALASFSKNVRRQNVHRLQLTWLGVIFQFLWRLGTISARICALTAYALVYKYWVFLVIGLHWVSMFLWLLSPKTVFDGERLGRGKKAVLSALIAGVYVLAYINLQELRPRPTMVTFYGVMFVENALLLCAWWSGAGGGAGAGALPAAAGAYCLGLGFMLLYYRYFHVRRLGYMLGENQQGTNSTNASSQNKNGKQSNAADNAAIPGVFNCRFTNPVNNSATGRKKKKPTSFVPPPPAPATAFWRRPLPHNHHGGSSENEGSSVGSRVNIQQKLQEKKQKQLAELRVIEEEIKQGKLAKTTPVAAEEIYSSLQRQPIPRAKTHAEPLAWPSIDVSHPYQNYPVPHTCNYPTYTEIKNYTNFQNNNTENELKIHRRYEEPRTFYENPANLHNETVLRSPNYLENRSYESNCGSPRNVLNNSLTNYIDNYEAPSDKRLPNVYEDNDFSYSEQYGKELHVLATVPSLEVRGYECGAGRCARRALRGRCRTPEVLLAPHYLEACSRPVCCHWGAHTNRKKEEGAASSGEESAPDGAARDTPRPPSDIDSQISLPRSYTLPREFRYWRRRPRLRDAHLPSNNSSDGDVDSGDNDSDRRSNCSAASQLQTYSELRHAPTHASHGAHGPHAHGAHGPHGAHAHGPHAPLALDDYERRRRRKPAPKPETKL